jgi:hypothetical protein
VSKDSSRRLRIPLPSVATFVGFAIVESINLPDTGGRKISFCNCCTQPEFLVQL